MTNKNPTNSNLKANLIRLLLFSIFAFWGFFIIRDAYSLISKSYLTFENKLIPLDTIQLLNRAYKYSASKGSRARLEFESISRHKFEISAERLSAINDINKLTDTLMYHGTEFLVYTDKDGLEKYKDNSASVIEVYQLVLGDKEYVDLAQANQIKKDDLIRGLLVWGLLLVVVLLVFFFKKENNMITDTADDLAV